MKTDFAASEALKYCEKYFALDMNGNFNESGESGILNGYGVCEDRVYCFNIIECSLGPNAKIRLTPEKCKTIMCDFYIAENKNNNETAAAVIQKKMHFGSCNINNSAIMFTSKDKSVSLAKWWTNNFQNVHCPGKTG